MKMKVRIISNVSYHTKLKQGDIVEIEHIDSHSSKYTGRDMTFYYVKDVTFNGGDEPFYLLDREFELIEEENSMKKTKVINIIGAPSAGKSTMAAKLFYELKVKGYTVELITEYAKDLVYEERHATFDDELYVFAKQNHRIHRCIGKVDFVITDAPIVQKLYYQPKEFDFRQTVMNVFNQYDNINFFLKRKGYDYETAGRLNTEEESERIHREMMQLLDKFGVRYEDITHDDLGSIIKQLVG